MTHMMEQMTIPGLDETALFDSAQGATVAGRPRWLMVKLGDVCLINPRHPKDIGSDDLVSFVPMQSISEASKTIVSEVSRPYSEVSKGYTPFQLGDVLLAKITPCFENGKTAIADIKNQYGSGSSEFHVFRPKDQEHLMSRFVYYFFQLKSFIEDASKNMTGSAGQKRVPKSYLETIQIPLPPLPEQQRIVARLDKAQQLIDQRKEQLKLMDALVQSLFYEMFGDPVKNEKGWKKVSLKEFGKIQTGNTPPRNVVENYGSFIEWIKSDNIVKSSPFLLQSSEYLSEKGALKGRIAEENSILICCIAGSRESIGRAGMANRRVAFNQQINAITPKSQVNPWFLLIHFRVAQSLVQEASTNSMKGMISKSAFSEIEFLLPPLPLQQAFADRVQQIETLKQSMTASLRELEHNFNALMQEAFGQ